MPTYLPGERLTGRGGSRSARVLVAVLCLLASLLQGANDAFDKTYNEQAWQSFFGGIQLLEQGAPRAGVLRHWEETLKLYGTSMYGEQLRDLVGELRKQVAEDLAIRATDVAHPEALPVLERIDYYIARFPDVHGEQRSGPGRCITVGLGEGTRISDAIVAIGRPAVPKLIEHLEDWRITRSVGFPREWEPVREVLRAQDAALQCIERIVHIRFCLGGYLSTKAPQVRAEVIADIKSWWQENRDRTPVEGLRARLDRGKITWRLRTLDQIEELNPYGVDSIAVLKRWATAVEANELPEIAFALAARQDMSLLPEIRRLLYEKTWGLPSGCVPFMLRYGNAGDYRFLREAAGQDRQRGAKPGMSGVLGEVVSSIKNRRNPLAAPILVDLLDCREMTDSRWISKERGIVACSCADSCMETLIRLTEHDEGYHLEAPAAERYVAMDRWLLWWRARGESEYLQRHPEVKPVADRGPERE